MKIQSTTKNLYNFKAGMGNNVLSEIARTDCAKVQYELLHRNYIDADFANNKIIAWSVAKVVEMFTEMQRKYNRTFFSPIQIRTESLDKIGREEEKNYATGYVNFLPAMLHKASDKVTPAMSIIFNKDFPWESLDEISDIDYAKKNTVSDNFLEYFIHEFFHVFHNGYLLMKFSPKEAVKKLDDLSDPKNVIIFQEKFGDLIENNLCGYAKESPFELIACDMSKRFIEGLDDQFNLTRNPFESSPYSRFYKFIKLVHKKDPLDDLIYDVYNGRLNRT